MLVVVCPPSSSFNYSSIVSLVNLWFDNSMSVAHVVFFFHGQNPCIIPLTNMIVVTICLPHHCIFIHSNLFHPFPANGGVPRAFGDLLFRKIICLRNECVERCLCLANMYSTYYAWDTQYSDFAYTSIYLKFRKEYVYHICSWSFPWNSHWPKIQTFFVTFWHSFHMSSLISHHKMVVSKTFDGFVGSFTLEEDDSWLLMIFWMGGANYLSWERNFWIFQVFFSRQVEVFIIYTPLNISKQIPQMKCSVILGIYVMLNFGT